MFKIKMRFRSIPRKFVYVAIIVLIVGVAGLIAVSIVQSSDKLLSVVGQQYLPGIGGNSIVQASDGGYLALGQSASVQDGSFINYTSLVVKTDPEGNPTWSKNYSIDGMDTRLTLAVQVSDGYVLAGSRAVKTIFPLANSTEFGVATQQFCLLKIDPQGNIQWANTYVEGNQSGREVAGYSLGSFIQTSDGGYALIGSYTFPSPSDQYLWLVKTDAAGDLQWNQTIYVGSYASAIFQTNDEGYVIVGTQTSHGPSPEFYEMIKVDSSGSVQWYHTFGGKGDFFSARSYSGATTSDGGFLIVGSASSQGGAPTGWIVKTNGQGAMLWNTKYSYNNYPTSITSISQAGTGFMFIGMATKETNYGVFDANSRTYTWVVQIDEAGNIQGQVVIDTGHSITNPTSIVQTLDGRHVFVGIWNQSAQPPLSQKFWFAKIANFSAIPYVWFSLNLAIVISVILIEGVIVISVWKRIRRNSNSN